MSQATAIYTSDICTRADAVVMLAYLSGCPMTIERMDVALEAFRRNPDWRTIDLLGIAWGGM